MNLNKLIGLLKKNGWEVAKKEISPYYHRLKATRGELSLYIALSEVERKSSNTLSMKKLWSASKDSCLEHARNSKGKIQENYSA